MSAAAATCFHCGEPVPVGGGILATIDGQARSLCCRGCEAAALLIDAAGLAAYYRWRSAVAPRPALQKVDPWTGFDRSEVARTLERDGDRTRVHLAIEGLRCAACGWLIEQRLRQITGITDVSLNPATARARVEFQSIPLSAILRAIADLGYTPHLLGRSDTRDVGLRERRAALKRVAVAGFGMMQVMMIAVALYESQRVGMSPVIRDYLRIISLLITTPVMLYAGAPFLAGAWRQIRARRLGMDVPVSLGILLAYGASAWNTFRDAGDVYFDSVVMFVFLLLLGRYLEMLARHHAASAAEALSRLLPATARRLRAGGDERVPVAMLAVGDRVRVESGEPFPADGVVEDAETLCDESLLTGESAPVLKRVGAPVVGGAINVLRPVVVALTRIGDSTTLAGIARLLERAASARPARAVLADRIAGWFVACVLAGALLTALTWLRINPSHAFAATLAVLVATCPCALSLATPVAVTAAMGALARRGILVSRPDALERLADASTVVIDKTGTLTLAEPRLMRVQVAGTATAERCTRIAAGLEDASGHPLARAFTGMEREPVAAVAVVAGEGIEGRIEGNRYRIGQASYVAQIAGRRPATLADDGIHLGSDGQWLARFEIADTIRPGAGAAAAALRREGLELEVASGDHPAAVAEVARAVGIGRWTARMRPEDKMARVRALHAEAKRVVLVGDGANDAPGLGAADVSIAMGCGSALARAQADLIVLGGDLGAIAAAVRHARRTRRIIRQNLVWAAGYNLASLPLAAAGLVPPWIAAVGMSLSSLLVVGSSLRLSRVDGGGGSAETAARRMASAAP